MSLGARIKEERQRLGLTQTAFAAIAGASKRAMVNWEKDDTSPLASQVVAWGEAGADAAFILTGSRQEQRRADAVADIRDELASIRRALLDPTHDDDTEDNPTSLSQRHANALSAILANDISILPNDLLEETKSLLALALDPALLRARRIAEHGAQRSRRDQTRRKLADWFDGRDYQPSAGTMHMLLTISHEYGVPARALSDLVEELHTDFSDRAGQATNEADDLLPQR